MGATKSLGILAVASVVWLCSFSAKAEEEKNAPEREHKHEEKAQPQAPEQEHKPEVKIQPQVQKSEPKHETTTPPQALSAERKPEVTVQPQTSLPERKPEATVQPQAPSHERKPVVTVQPQAPTQERILGAIVQPQTPARHTENNPRRSEDPIYTTIRLVDAVTSHGSSSESEPSSAPPSFTSLSDALDKDGFALYWGAGLGRSKAYYASTSNSESSWKLFFGGRGRYLGMDFGFNKLSRITAPINGQLVDVSTETYSLSLVGYIPLGDSADIYLKYGSVYWNVNASSNATGYLPVKDGFSQVRGAGLEVRGGAYFLRLERESFNRVYQSSSYTFTGISLGEYF